MFYDSPGYLYDTGLLYDSPDLPQQGKKRMAKVKLGLNSLNPQDLVALANTIKTAMTGNANFTTPNPTLTAVGTAITAGQTKIAAYDAAVAAAKTALADRDAALTALRTLLTQLSAYVENITAGDKTKIESSGMGVRADRTSAGVPDRVMGLVVTEGDNQGTLDASWDPQKSVLSYEIQISGDPPTDTSWTFKMSATKSSATIPALVTSSKMWVRVRAVGADNAAGPWSDPAFKVVP
jgi:hypothetical protein